ncbi:MAG TPA: energy-coupling factor transporter transmembrane component T [archaeon]|nr:energy-coupling factor transporter transmembrane component T [archaeon]
MFQYYNKSFFSGASESLKILFLLVFFIAAFTANSFAFQGILFIVIFALLVVAGFKDFRKLFLGLVPFLLLADFGFWFFLQGTQINVANLVVVSNLRIFNLVMAAVFFSFSTDAFALVKLMKKMHFPEVIFLPLFVLFRFLPEIEKDFGEIRDIQKMRGIGIKKPVLFLRSLLTPLFLTVLEKADELAIAYYLRKKAGREL